MNFRFLGEPFFSRFMGHPLGTLPIAGGFTPQHISGLILWLDGSVGGSFWQDAAGTTAAAAGDPVGRWDDQSGSGNHVTQTVAADRPTRQSGYITPAAGDYLFKTSFPNLSAITAFAVASYDTGIDTSQAILDINNNAATNTGYMLYHEATGKFRETAAAEANSGNDYRDDGTRLHVIYEGSPQNVYRVNGANVAAVNTVAHGALARIDVCRLFGAASFTLIGRIYEIAIYNRTLDTDERALVEEYYNLKYGLGF